MKRESTALIVQDTSELNFSTRSACEGLGQIGSNQTGAQSRGLDLHSRLAVGGQSGLPLGVLRLHGYAPESAKGKDPHRPIQDKESYRWLEVYEDACRIAALIPETRVISVADREGDMFELFDLRRGQQGLKAELLVRASMIVAWQDRTASSSRNWPRRRWPRPSPLRCPASGNAGANLPLPVGRRCRPVAPRFRCVSKRSP